MGSNVPSVKLYLDKAGEWRWQVRAVNGKIIGCSSEGYVRRIDCCTNMHRLYQAFEPPILWTKGSQHDEHQGDRQDDSGESAGGDPSDAV